MKKNTLIASILAAGSTIIALKYLQQIRNKHLIRVAWHTNTINPLDTPICFKPVQHPVAQGSQVKFTPNGVSFDSDVPLVVPDEDKKIHAAFAEQLDGIIQEFAHKVSDHPNAHIAALHDILRASTKQAESVKETVQDAVIDTANLASKKYDEAKSALEKPVEEVKKKFEHIAVSVIGEDKEAGEISPTSKSFRSILTKALKAADKNVDYRLTLVGQTYGLGAKGIKNEDGSVSYTSVDIKKLIKKAESVS